MKRMPSAYPLLLLVLAGALAPADAEEYMKRGASVEDYEQALNRVMERKRRGLVTGREHQSGLSRQPEPPLPSTSAPPAAPRTSGHQTTRPRPEAAPAVRTPPASHGTASDGVSLYFDRDSARLTADARAALDTLGQALAQPRFRDVSWIVEGHTDAMGSDEYNQALSEERARSAQLYLIERCGIPPEKLTAVGKGEQELYDRERPLAALNRRVRLRPADD